MKPPPRTRTKPNRNLKPESAPQRSGKVVCKWRRAEQRKLLYALKKLSKTGGEIDYAFLRKSVPARSVSEVHSVVESLKNKVISRACFKLKKNRWEEKKVRKPIELWTHLASAVAGTAEDAISTAFSQMLTVSSTEPCTLRNCDPPTGQRPHTYTNRPVGHRGAMRPMPCLPVQGHKPGTNTSRPLQVVKTSAPTTGSVNIKTPPPQQQLSATIGTSPAATSTTCQLGAETPPQPPSETVSPVTGQVRPSSVAVVKTAGDSDAVIQTTQQQSEQHPTTISTASTSKSNSSSPHIPHSSSATSQTTVPSPKSSSVAPSTSTTSSCFTPPLSTPAAACHATFGHTSQYARKDRMFTIKSGVDFERIYRYLSVIHKPTQECHLNPMESAIVLDLLMSLPEELRLLDCNKLHKHLIQVYQCLSSPADSKIAKEMFQNLNNGQAQTESPSGQDINRTNSRQMPVETADSTDATDSEEKTLQPGEAESQSSGNDNLSSQSGDRDVMGHCPPLNPFVIPLKLLMRR